MPTYEYRCEANGKIVEVKHGMSEDIKTWGQLCELADIVPGKTSKSAKVEKIISQSNVLRNQSGPSAGDLPCNRPGGCACM